MFRIPILDREFILVNLLGPEEGMIEDAAVVVVLLLHVEIVKAPLQAAAGGFLALGRVFAVERRQQHVVERLDFGRGCLPRLG